MHLFTCRIKHSCHHRYGNTHTEMGAQDTANSSATRSFLFPSLLHTSGRRCLSTSRLRQRLCARILSARPTVLSLAPRRRRSVHPPSEALADRSDPLDVLGLVYALPVELVVVLHWRGGSPMHLSAMLFSFAFASAAPPPTIAPTIPLFLLAIISIVNGILVLLQTCTSYPIFIMFHLAYHTVGTAPYQFHVLSSFPFACLHCALSPSSVILYHLFI